MDELYMRCCPYCLPEEQQSAIAINYQIHRALAEQKKRERSEIKVLLLGTGESGKTTFMKQMRIIHGHSFSEHERHSYTKLVFQNIFTSMRAMTQAMSTLKIPYVNPQNEINAQLFQHLENHEIHHITQLQKVYVEPIRQLWEDQGFKICYKRQGEYQLLDSTAYFMKHLDRIATTAYVPTDQDILQVRFPTTGITDHCFTFHKITLRIVDVGGQKGQRKKWLNCFENVTSLIFLASLSEYDQLLEENNKDKRMQESLSLYYTIIHSDWFCNSSVILFLNKSDILAEKIQFSDLRACFPDFQGKRRDAQDAMKFIEQLYKQQEVCRETKNKKNVYRHFTCATDTSNIQTVFTNVRDTVLMASIKHFIMN